MTKQKVATDAKYDLRRRADRPTFRRQTFRRSGTTCHSKNSNAHRTKPALFDGTCVELSPAGFVGIPSAPLSATPARVLVWWALGTHQRPSSDARRFSCKKNILTQKPICGLVRALEGVRETRKGMERSLLRAQRNAPQTTKTITRRSHGAAHGAPGVRGWAVSAARHAGTRSRWRSLAEPVAGAVAPCRSA